MKPFVKISTMYSIIDSKGIYFSDEPKKPRFKKKNLKKYIKLAPKYVKGMESEFYKTNEWKELRKRVFRKYGHRCMCCGDKSKTMHIDHIKPRSKYPHLELVFDNLQVLCKDCNMAKSNINENDYRQDHRKYIQELNKKISNTILSK
jgi:5-methylcytosine-specific restriction endonuclease McrA